MKNIKLTKNDIYRALEERQGKTLTEALSHARVAICGLGGLGSNVAVMLARAGVGSLHLIDFDAVDITNLNRQNYTVQQLGRYKTDALCEYLLSIAPYCNIKSEFVKLNEENICNILRDDSIICEAFDSAETKAMLVDLIIEKYPEKYIVSGSGMAGIGSANKMQTRRVGKRLYICGDEISDAYEETALLSSRVMLCAAHEAHMIIRLIAGEYDV